MKKLFKIITYIIVCITILIYGLTAYRMTIVKYFELYNMSFSGDCVIALVIGILTTILIGGTLLIVLIVSCYVMNRLFKGVNNHEK